MNVRETWRISSDIKEHLKCHIMNNNIGLSACLPLLNLKQNIVL